MTAATRSRRTVGRPRRGCPGTLRILAGPRRHPRLLRSDRLRRQRPWSAGRRPRRGSRIGRPRRRRRSGPRCHRCRWWTRGRGSSLTGGGRGGRGGRTSRGRDGRTFRSRRLWPLHDARRGLRGQRRRRRGRPLLLDPQADRGRHEAAVRRRRLRGDGRCRLFDFGRRLDARRFDRFRLWRRLRGSHGRRRRRLLEHGLGRRRFDRGRRFLSDRFGRRRGAGFTVFTRRGGGSIGATGFGGSGAFFAGAGFLPLFGAGVSAKMSPVGSAMFRCLASRSTN